MTLSFKSLLETNSTIDTVGEMLNDYWHLKKSLSKKVTNYKIDEIYNIAMNSGASGGKVIGSGGGGFILVYCKKKFQSNLRKNLKNIILLVVKRIYKKVKNILNK